MRIIEVGNQYRIVCGEFGFKIEFYAGRNANREEVWMDYNWDENERLLRILSQAILNLSQKLDDALRPNEHAEGGSDEQDFRQNRKASSTDGIT